MIAGGSAGGDAKRRNWMTIIAGIVQAHGREMILSEAEFEAIASGNHALRMNYWACTGWLMAVSLCALFSCQRRGGRAGGGCIKPLFPCVA